MALPTEGPLDLASDRLDHLDEDIQRLVEGNEWRGLQWVIEEPEVRGAVIATLDRLTTELIELLVGRGSERMEAAVRVRTLVFGIYFTSLEEWYRAGHSSSFATCEPATRMRCFSGGTAQATPHPLRPISLMHSQRRNHEFLGFIIGCPHTWNQGRHR